MQSRGPLATLLAVLVAGVAVVATNLVLTDGGPPPERTASLGLSADGYGTDDGYGGSGAGAYAGSRGGADGTAPAAPATPAPQAAAAPGAAAPAPASYDGRTAGDEVTVALKIADGGAATAYVCDGKGVESWMRGTVEGSAVKLTGKDGAVLDGRTENGAAFGTVQVGGKSWPFAAAPTKKKTADGPAAADQPAAPGTPAPYGATPTGGWS